MRDCALYCVRMEIWRMPEFTQFESTKSTMRNLPPKGVAGLARCEVRSLSRSPRPPAMITANVPPKRQHTKQPKETRADRQNKRHKKHEEGTRKKPELNPISATRARYKF